MPRSPLWRIGPVAKSSPEDNFLKCWGWIPYREKTPLHPKITGQVEHDGFTVEKLHFQSRPGLYVTGNLYVPRDASKPLPAILYVCGHGRVKKDGVSYGNKVHYHHHGSWFARHGYVCLTIDTLQLGEIEGIHHGTHRENMWWWLNRGYTPAGVEAWNCVRAIDYLQSRDEVDDARIGVTGRSGGGAYSWWIAAIDDRIKCAVPVAGVTDLQSHVVDGCVEGHCDCMFLVNTYRWDYPLVAALVAPRPLLISNTDSDGIFPLDGVYRTFEKVRTIYSLYEAADKVALNITAGPHQDTQELRVHAFRWLNRHLKGDESLIEQPAVKYFEPEQLRVFDELPTHEANTAIHESFVATAEVPIPTSEEAWHVLRDRWRQALVDKVFAGWPARESPLDIQAAFTVEREGVVFRAVDFTSQRHIRLRLYGVHRAGLDKPDLLTLNVLDTGSWSRFLGTMRVAFEAELDGETLPGPDEQAWGAMRDRLRSSSQILAYVAPRGIGPTAWDQDARKQTQHRRRFYLLGQSLDGMRVYDVRRAIQSIRAHLQGEVPIRLKGRGRMAGIALYASLFEPGRSEFEPSRPATIPSSWPVFPQRPPLPGPAPGGRVGRGAFARDGSSGGGRRLGIRHRDAQEPRLGGGRVSVDRPRHIETSASKRPSERHRVATRRVLQARHIATQTAGRRHVGSTGVVHDHAMRTKSPSQRADGIHHHLDPLLR